MEYEEVKISLSSFGESKDEDQEALLPDHSIKQYNFLYFCVLMFCSLNNNYYVITDSYNHACASFSRH